MILRTPGRVPSFGQPTVALPVYASITGGVVRLRRVVNATWLCPVHQAAGSRVRYVGRHRRH